MLRFSRLWVLPFAALALACETPKSYDTTVEVVHIQRFGDGKTPGLVDLELKFPDCGGDARRLVRLDKTFAACAPSIKDGDKLPASLTLRWNSEKGSYRSDFTKIANCAAKADPKDEANYELVQVCSDMQATGSVVGVHCDRTRPKELIAKCPFLRRK